MALWKVILLGHCIRHREEIASNLVLWQPSHGTPNRGRKRTTYIGNLLKDTNMRKAEELYSLINDRDTWKMIVHNCIGGTGWHPAKHKQTFIRKLTK